MNKEEDWENIERRGRDLKRRFQVGGRQLDMLEDLGVLGVAVLS